MQAAHAYVTPSLCFANDFRPQTLIIEPLVTKRMLRVKVVRGYVQSVATSLAKVVLNPKQLRLKLKIICLEVLWTFTKVLQCYGYTSA